MNLDVPLSELLRLSQGRVVNAESVESTTLILRGIRDLGQSGRGDVAFFFSKEVQGQLRTADPTILVVGEPFVEPLKGAGLPIWKSAIIVACADPYLAMARISGFFAPLCDVTVSAQPSSSTPSIHPSACVDPTATIGQHVWIGPGVVVDAQASIGSGSRLEAGVKIGRGVRIGERSVFFPNVVVYSKCVIGDDVRIHAGSVIGSDGFGYAPVIVGGRPIGHEKIHHFGSVRIGNRVEMGSNVSVDRGTWSNTLIGDDVKIDNLVQVAHNVVLERGAVICGGTALAGGVRVCEFAYIGGQTGIANRVIVGPGAKVAALALVTKDVPAGGTAVGNPQRSYAEHFRVHAALNRSISRKNRIKDGRNERTVSSQRGPDTEISST